MKCNHQVWKKASSLLLCILLVAAIPLQALAVEQDPATDPIPLTEEAATYLVTLKNFDGNETLQTLSVAQDATLTRAEIDAQLTAPMRGGYLLVGWSIVKGDVVPGITVDESWTIDADTTLYAVYRPVLSTDVDVEFMVDAMSTIEELDLVAKQFGISLQTLINAPERDTQFYEHLERYLREHAPDEVAAASRESRSTGDTLSGQRMRHAFEDAEWSVSQHPDLDFSAEVVYMYTAHYIDKPQAFGDTNVGCTNNYLEQYITDMDRNTYRQFYSRGNASRILASGKDLVSAACSVKDAAGQWIPNFRKVVTFVDMCLGGFIGVDAAAAKKSIQKIGPSNFEAIIKLDDENYEAIEAGLLNLEKGFSEQFMIDTDGKLGDIGKAAFRGLIAIAIGSGNIAVVAPFIFMYADLCINYIDMAIFTAMRMYINARVANRIRYCYGMTDGRGDN